MAILDEISKHPVNEEEEEKEDVKDVPDRAEVDKTLRLHLDKLKHGE